MIITIEFMLRFLALSLFALWWFYWRITERQAEDAKPKKIKKDIYGPALRILILMANSILVLQLFGLNLLPMSFSNQILFSMQVSGFLLIVIGMIVAVSARKTLGHNWSHAADYQVKKGQELVTSGMYSVIRHPIYSGLVVGYIGGELLVQSYLVVIGLLMYAGGYYQARLEEKLLQEHYKESYTLYMRRTKRFIPYLW